MCLAITKHLPHTLVFSLSVLFYSFTLHLSASEHSIKSSLSKPDLNVLIQSVKKNESLVNPIKVTYRKKWRREGDPAPRSYGMRKPGRRYSFADCTWVHSGHRHNATSDIFYGPNELARKMHYVIDEKNNLYSAISPPKRDVHIFKWNADITITALGLRPFEGNHKLSDILIDSCLRVHPTQKPIGKRLTWVIDAKRIHEPVYYARIWIDPERGIALRTEYFGKDPETDRSKIGTIDSIALTQLPNGGWFPLSGRRTIHFKDRTSHSLIKVDPSSITIDPNDMPDSLFNWPVEPKPLYTQ